MYHELNFQLMLISIFAVANNFKSLGNFLQLTEKLPRREQLKITTTASFASLCVMLVALLFGGELLKFLNVSLDSFRVAGGMVLVLLGMDMIHARSKPEDELTSPNNHSYNYSSVISTAIIPIAIPLTTGAGTFSTIIIFQAAIGNNAYLYWQLVAAIVVQAIINYIVFRYSTHLLHLLGKVGMSVLTRLVGLVTLTLGVQFVTVGLGAIFPGWTHI